MPDVNNVAESSAAATPTPMQYDGWDEHGTPIVKKTEVKPKSEEPAASAAPAKVAQSEPKGETAAESEAAPKQEKKAKPKLSADERIEQLEATIDRIRKESGQRKDVKEAKAEPSPAKPEAKAAQYTRPKPATDDKNSDGTPKYKSYEEWQEDLVDWKVEQREVKLRQELAMEAAKREFDERIAAGKKLYPDFEHKAKETATAIMAEDVPPFVKAFVNESEVFEHLVFALGDGPLESIIELSKTNPGKALRALRDLERDTEAAVKAPKKEEAAAEPPAKPKPRAPTPPAEVGGRGASPPDAAGEAARSGNFRQFEAEMNRRNFGK